MTLYLFNFNNYYNRIVKRYNTIGEYTQHGTELAIVNGVNFNPNDGVSTKQIINYIGTDMPDYLVCLNPDNTINTRWFVIEGRRTLGGQYELTLFRDLVADWYEKVISAPCFIEKAMLSTNNNLIFNNENMAFNQIKTSEQLIDGNCGTAWYAAYINKNVGEIELEVPLTSYPADIVVTNLENYSYIQYRDTNYKGEITEGPRAWLNVSNIGTGLTYCLGINASNNAPETPKDGKHRDWMPTGITELERNSSSSSNSLSTSYNGSTEEKLSKALSDWNSAVSAVNVNDFLLDNAYASDSTIHEGTPILNENEKIIFVQTSGKYYKVSVKQTGIGRTTKRFSNTSNVGLELLKAYNNQVSFNYTTSGQPIALDYNYNIYRIELNELYVQTANITIPATRRKCADAPYDILMFPASDIEFKLVSGEDELSTLYHFALGSISEGIINQLMLKLAEAELYDIQLIPYCSIAEELMSNYKYTDIIGNGIINLSNYYERNVDYVTGNSSLCFMPQFASFTKTITNERYIVSMPSDAIEFKVENETNVYRLCSPNYNGQFEFSAAKNRGITGYNVTCTLKPHSPYIKVAPIFAGLYGRNFNDARGLICGGDFSISQISNNWTNYELQNKNYQIMFDRQIQNMEFNNSIARTSEMANAITGVVSAGVTGGFAGANMGGGIGATVGAIIGAGASAYGGAMDRYYNEQLRRETLDYTKDQFGYQLGNIKALPYNITKISSRNADNKIFPFIEYYTCTDEEKEALRNKIRYNGMTVMTINTIETYLTDTPTYIKGKIIRIENIPEETHVIDVIASEINKGVYI